MSDYVSLATLIYVFLQAGYLLWTWYREYRKTTK